MRCVAAWSAVALLLGACVSAPADAIPAAWQERADELTERACTQAQSCACDLSTASSPCESVLADRWRARLVAGHELDLEWDDDCATAIGDAIDAAACDSPAEGADHPCHSFCQVLHGDRELGQRCHGLDELASDCARDLLCDRGRCVDPCTRLTGLAQGEACRDDSGNALDRCADGLVCDGASDRCQPGIPIGSPCDHGQCGFDAYCAWFEEPAVCRPAGVEGSDCEYADCASGFSCRYDESLGHAVCLADAALGESCAVRGCSEGLWCSNASTCTGPAELGASCYEAPCADDLVCDYVTYSCTTPPAIGAPCDQGVCAQGAWCDTSSTTTSASCRAVLADDAPCSGHSQCESGFCPAGACRPRPRLGEDCSGTLACAKGLSCDGTVCRESATNGPAICVYDGW